MKAKRIFAAIFSTVLFALILCLTACSGVDMKKGDLTVLGKLSDMNKNYMQKIFDAYESATGKELNIVTIEDADFEKQAAKYFARNNKPDILMHFHNSDLNRFSIEDNFLDLSDQSWVSDLTDSAKNYCTDSSGRLLGLPFWESSVSGCYYNKTILDSLGLNRASTQKGFNDLCDALKQAGYTPICWPANGCSWMYQFGLDPIFADDPDTLSALNEGELSYADIAEAESMVSWIKSAADKGWFGQNYFETGWEQISPVMSSGGAVMTFIWDTWFYTDFTPGEYTVDDFDIMPIFMGTEDEGTFEGGNLNMMMVNKNSSRLDTALDFLSFCATPENYNRAFENISTVKCFNGMTTNIQSKMVTENAQLISAKERVSTASTKIIGYSAEDMADAVNRLLHGKTDVKGCVALMDQNRHAEAREQGLK